MIPDDALKRLLAGCEGKSLVEPVYDGDDTSRSCLVEGFGQMGRPRLAIVVAVTLVALAGCGAEERPPAEPATVAGSTVPATAGPCAHPPVTDAAVEAAGSATITEPHPGDQVAQHLFLVSGRVEGTAPDVDLWVLSYSPSLGRFWIEAESDGPVAVDGDRRFSTIATLSSGDGAWQLIAVLADEQASTALSGTVASWNAANDWPGLAPEELPTGLTEKDCVPVVR